VNRKPQLEVYITGLKPRHTYSIVIDDRIVGSFSTDDHGSTDIQLQDGAVPNPLDGIGLSPLMLPSGCVGADAGIRQTLQSFRV
jgi:hypothetical protein